MTQEAIILALAVITNFLLALLVYLRNPKSATHRLLSTLCLSIIAWSTITYFAVNAHSNPTATWLVRLVMFSSTSLGVFFFLLMHTFPRFTLALSKKRFFIVIALMVLTMVVSLTPLLFPIVTPSQDQAPQPQPGIGMVLYVPVVIFSIIYGIYLLVQKTRKARGIERAQMVYLLTGTLIMFSLIISFNFVAVTVFKTTLFTSLGPVFTLPFTLLASYAIIRHRLMDVQLAILRGISFVLLIGSFLLVYGLLIIFAVPSLSDLTGLPSGVIAGAAAFASIPVASIIRDFLKRLTDRFLFQNHVDYQKALVHLSDELSGTIKIEEVTSTVLKGMQEVMRSKKSAIVLQDSSTGNFVPRAFEGIKNFRINIPAHHILLQHLRHAKGTLVKDELELLKEQESSSAHAKEIEVIHEAFTWLDVAVVIPLFVNKELTGLILLGDKLSGQPYLRDDIDFLAAFAPLAATALDNARLYKESLEFSERLKVEVQQATRELALANVQLKDLDKAKSEFLSIASHQLYTPLTALRGYLSMLLEGDYGSLLEKQAPVIDILQKSTERLIILIKDLLDISRIESGRLELKLESVDLADMAKVLVQDLLPNAINKGLKLTFHLPSVHLPHVVADSQRIRQVMLNFVDNAIKYTPTGTVDVYIKQEENEAVFSVTDTGKGLSAEEITKLFNKFMRVGGANKYHTEGVGLGLYVAKQIVKEHKGDVLVESPGIDKGSTFSMRLPIEGSGRGLKLGDKATVIIKAAEASKAS